MIRTCRNNLNKNIMSGENFEPEEEKFMYPDRNSLEKNNLTETA
jgi:hypothetical protein